MDKALAYGARDCGFESRYGLLFFFSISFSFFFFGFESQYIPYVLSFFFFYLFFNKTKLTNIPLPPVAGCKKKNKSPWRDSNPQLSDPKSDALSIAPQGRVTLRYSAVLYMYAPQVPMELNCIYTALLLNTFGYDHINCNPPVLIRTPKLTQFEPAQYWGGGPPGNSAVLYPSIFFFFGFG